MLTFDIETTNKQKGNAGCPDNRLVMIAWCEDDGVIHHHYGPMPPREFLDAADRHSTICAYHAKFEQKWFLRWGLDPDNWEWHDPMLAEKVILGNKRLPMGLGAVSGRYGYSTKDKLIDTLMRQGVCPSEMPKRRLIARCRRDVRTARSLHYALLSILRNAKQYQLYRTRCDMSGVLARMEMGGMDLDAKLVREETDRVKIELAATEKALDKLTGGINLRSPDQVATFLYKTLGFPEKTGAGGKPLRNKPSKQFPDGRPKTDQHTMAWLASKATTDKQREFIALRQKYGKLNAQLTKNLEFFSGVCDEYKGHFSAQFNQAVTATHRLSSSGVPLEFKDGKTRSVQFQNLPREYKRLFVSPNTDYVVMEIDYSQLEFRVAAQLGDDVQARKDIADPDFDAHCRTASVMFDKDYATFLSRYREGNSVYGKLRTQAKPDTFKPLYGGTKGTPEQEKYYKAFAERYSGIRAEQENWLAEVERTGCLTLPWGMTFHWDTHMNRKGVLLDSVTRKPVGPSVFNYPVQSLATAEIVPIGILLLYRACKQLDLRVQFVNTVHDSVILLVRKDDVDDVWHLAKETMAHEVPNYLRERYGYDFDVPLGIEAKYGSHWGQGTTLNYDPVGGKDGKD